MKNTSRFLVVLLAILFLFPCVSYAKEVFPWGKTYAELQNDTKVLFANSSDEDLLVYYELIEIEIERRGLEPLEVFASYKETAVPPGRYTVGKDIPADTYTVESAGTLFALMYVYSPTGSLVEVYNVTPSTGIGKLELEEGQTLQFTGDTIIFSPYKGLEF